MGRKPQLNLMRRFMTDEQKKKDNRKRTIKNRWENLTREKKDKLNCRAYTRKAIRRGSLLPQPCETCGKPYEEAHHDDYANFRDVRWFCSLCHHKFHGNTIHPKYINEIEEFKLEQKVFENKIPDNFDIFTGDYSPCLEGDSDADS